MARRARAAQRRAKAEAEKAVAVEILEVPADGMDMETLCDLLATSQAEVIKVLFLRGIAIQMGQVLDRDTVIAVAEAQDVEWIDLDEKGVEEGARKTTEFYEDEDEDDLVADPRRHHHGPRRPRQDIAPGLHPQQQGGIRRGWRYHPSHRRVSGVHLHQRGGARDHLPGHARARGVQRHARRGARVTDVAIVVVAADDGVRPQTKEAVSHAKAAGVPLIIAINKIDKEGANPDRVKEELAALEVVCEEWGGETPMIQVSAKQGTGVEELLETIALTAEVEELVANPDRNARGTVVEAYLDKKRGAMATLLVQTGTLRMGDPVLVGANWGKVRAISDAYGETLEEAGPSTPVQIMGLGGVPMAGEEFDVMDSEAKAREAAEARASADRINIIEGNTVSLSNLAAAKGDEDGVQTINIIVKTDVSGSVEAVKAALGALPQDRVILRFLHAAAGEVTESDIDLAAASEGIILAFNTSVSDKVEDRAKAARVELRAYDVIYGLVDEVRAAMEGKLSGVQDEVFVGKAECKAVFGGGNSKVAGVLVLDGELRMKANLRVTRKGKEQYVGKVGSLRRVKDQVKKVESGLECGVGADPEWGEWKPGTSSSASILSIVCRRSSPPAMSSGRRCRSSKPRRSARRRRRRSPLNRRSSARRMRPPPRRRPPLRGSASSNNAGKQKAGSRR